jgi:hypothetical protein
VSALKGIGNSQGDFRLGKDDLGAVFLHSGEHFLLLR